MPALPSGWDVKVQAIHGVSPFVWSWLLPLHVEASLNLWVALTGHPSPVTIGGIKFYPYPMAQSEIEEDGEGNEISMQLTISNATRLLAPYLESPGDERGLLGREIWGYLVDASSPTTVMLWQLAVAQATLNSSVCVLRLEQRNLYVLRKPQDRFSTSRCRHKFGGEECGYIINGVAGFTTCDKTLPACIARGQDMAARNLPVLQPGTFGGFLGIPQA